MAWLIWSCAAFVAAVLSQAAALRLFRVRHAMVVIVCVGVPIGLALVTALFLDWSLDQAIAGMLVYAFLCELWMFVLSVTFSSVTAALLLHLRTQSKTLEEINLLFDNGVMIQNRIGWLAHIGAAVKNDNKLTATGGGLRVAWLFNAFRSFFGHH